MTHPHGPSSPCQDFAGILQPFVDGELSEQESHGLLDHLSSCTSCTQVVQEQQKVRALLRDLEPQAAPAALRTRVLAALDDADAQAQTAPAHTAPADKKADHAPINLQDRLRAMLRGALIMSPAAAAAGLMWVSLSPKLGAPEPQPQQGPAPIVAMSNPADKAEHLDADALPAASAPTILGGRGLPKDIEFVSAQPDVVRYRHAQRNFELIDRHHARAAPVPATAKIHKDGSHSYVLSRDALGRAHLDFALGSQRHRLTLVPKQAVAPSGAISAQDPHFAQLLHFARALQHAKGY